MLQCAGGGRIGSDFAMTHGGRRGCTAFKTGRHGPWAPVDRWGCWRCAAGLPQTVCPFPKEATHPRCYGEGCPDWPGRASNKEGES